MRKLTKRISLAAASAAVAGGAVLGAGGTASAAVPESAHVQRPAVSVKADDHRAERSVAYRHNSEEDHRQDGYRAREHSTRFSTSDRYDRRGHSYSWDDEGCSWKHDRNHPYDWDRSDRNSNRYDRDWDRYNHDSNRYDHDSNRYDHDSNRYDHDSNRYDHDSNRSDDDRGRDNR
ncbi:hypothetical protein [Streptomyces diastatochromogenes]|uniref:Uncharacterized protein n=1 Tax=Streptomyces diastatochromogenes TaxID=42236 RepID=A0A233SB64_STRDA|nr:hypothetical protein [Streptomyces diastatochromogenes]MCZ0985262.1 hypothetical protein [Streptomyces diastatochromogenes]OXY92759.1 hypothetical protein BEK98_25050 [Streptomyces diastatochromogenes]